MGHLTHWSYNITQIDLFQSKWIMITTSRTHIYIYVLNHIKLATMYYCICILTVANLGFTVDSSIAKWGMEGYNKDIVDKLGLRIVEKGHHEA